MTETPKEEPGKDEASSASEPPVPATPESPPKDRPRFGVKVRNRGSMARMPTKRYQVLLSVNVLSIFACVLGIISLILPWVQDVTGHYEEYSGLAYYLAHDTDLRFGMGAGLLAFGSMIVIVFRPGGLFQLAGLVTIASAIWDDWNPDMPGYFLGSLSAGFYCAAVGTAFGVGSMFIGYSWPVSERMLVLVRSKKPGAYRLNFLCLAAALLGIASIFLPWVLQTESYVYWKSYTYTYSAYSFIGYFYEPIPAAAFAILLVGALLMFITPLGSLVTLAGDFIFIIAVLPEFREGSISTYYQVSASAGVGWYLSALAASVALASLFYARRIIIGGRYLTWRREEEAAAPTSEPTAAGPVPDVAHREVTAQEMVRVGVVCVIVFLAAISPIVIAYVSPVSELEVRISNSDPDRPMNVAFFLDDRLMDHDVIGYGSQVVFSAWVRAGDHEIALDYVYVDSTTGGFLDGLPEYRTSVNVDPFVGYIFNMDLGFQPYLAPEATLSLVRVGEGVRATFESIFIYYSGVLTVGSLDWEELQVLLLHGELSAYWDNVTHYDMQTSGPPAFWHYGTPTSFGDLDVWFNATDLAGNGRIDVGDYFTLDAGNGVFGYVSTYEVIVLDERTSGMIWRGTI